ncbi:tyrosine-type recombinase/integrase [Hespellia stercorisuis]|uniref:Site-specific recombinase XerD n=1 Tax=Hespellia stercorisuis DSM 15480 TaxID=1121950 RepID=A0A1M6IA66_9FIRM|nr:tyrosine-type recombinase/integrase [Hespellia stercorisuis]SHJ31258.1 Site-specific recombinase XerD [Hespellia stercorisuis DSM 15480]
MEHKIHLKQMESYQHASEMAKKRMGRDPCFDLSLLPTEVMQDEMRTYIIQRSEGLSAENLYIENRFYHHLCQLIKEKGRHLNSFRDWGREMWVRQMKGWMLKQGLSLTLREKGYRGEERIGNAPTIRYINRLFNFLELNNGQDETDKDIWDLGRLDIELRVDLTRTCRTLRFTKIVQSDIRQELKKAIFFHLKTEALGCVQKEMTAMRRFSKYLSEKYPKIESCTDLDRRIFEEYLIYLKTEDTGVKQFRAELTRLRALLETIGTIYQYPKLRTMILNRDIPPTQRAEFKTYSDAELKRLNAFIVKADEQTARLMIIHQMLGTRISDTLTLAMDCLSEKDGTPIIRIKQMKTHTYEKPISQELAALIRKAIQYTKERYKESEYLFVSENNPLKPLQYGTLQTRIMRLINKEDIRDDHGNLFGFGTHMYRHHYGVKLTEMHLDDWTIARLLGHSSLKNVKYYRKMSNQMLADETRRVRNMISEMILANLDGWGEEYEQIRQDDNLK